MSDLDRRLRGVDQAEVPDLWIEAHGRASTATDRGPGSERQGRGLAWRRLGTVFVAFAVFVAAAVFAWGIWEAKDDRLVDEHPTPTAAPDPWAGLSPGIHRFSAPPSSRTGSALSWTGSRFLVWGGSQNDGAVQFDDGSAFDPTADAWDPLPPGPLSARSFPATVWTGREMLVWGGWDGGSGLYDDGAAYDPAAGTWRTIAPSPLDARAPRGAVWTGQEMIVWGSWARSTTWSPVMRPERRTTRRPTRGARSPTPLPDQLGVRGVDGRGDDRARRIGARREPFGHPRLRRDGLRPDRRFMEEAPPTDLDPNGTFAVWANDELFAFDYTNQVRAYDPVTDSWRELPAPPTDPGEAWPQFAAAGNEVFASTFGGPAVFDLTQEAWEKPDLPSALAGDPYLPTGAGDAVILWQSSAAQNPSDLLVWVPAPTALSSPLGQGLRIGRDVNAHGWRVLSARSGVWVAGAGELNRLGARGVRTVTTGDFDYDFTKLGEGPDGSILIASGTTLWQLDPSSGTILHRHDYPDLGYIDSILRAGPEIWVGASGEDGSQSLARIDPASGEVLDRYDVGQGGHSIAEADGYIFVMSAEPWGQALLRVDPASGTVVSVGAASGPIAAVGSHLWLANDQGVRCLDATTLLACGAIEIPRAYAVAADGDHLWVLSAEPGRPMVTLVDGLTGKVLAALRMPGRPSSISAFHGHAWVGFYDSGRVFRIDRCGSPSCG